MVFSPEVELQTLFKLDANRRIISTREPNPSTGPIFVLIRDGVQRVWAVGAEVDNTVANKLNALADQERPIADLREIPKHLDHYLNLLGGEISSGPSFLFPEAVNCQPGIAEVRDIKSLSRHFSGWTEDELPERSPIMAVLEDGAAVSVCFCARRSAWAAEAGVETAPAYRGRGLASAVTTAWAAIIRTSGLLPIYSTAWENTASLNVAHKLGLVARAQIWSILTRKFANN